MGNENKISKQSTSFIPTGRQMMSELARNGLTDAVEHRRTPGMMCQQGQDWSRGTACFPQKLVQLVGYRDPDKRPASPLRDRLVIAAKNPVPSDTPIG